MNLILSEPIGFCGGVRRALEIVERELQHNGAPLYILHEIVHNERVVSELRAKGVIVVEQADEVPEGATLIFSAHGVSEAVERHAKSLPLHIVDATCPLVRQTQETARKYSDQGFCIILFGKNGHREVEGILGRIPGKKILVETEADAENCPLDPGNSYICISQTTLNAESVDKLFRILQKRCPGIRLAKSVCSATKERQDSVRKLAKQCDMVLIAGSKRSSNTMRLAEAAQEAGTKALVVPDASCIDRALLEHVKTLGITSGASAPDSLIREIIDAVKICQPQ